MTAKTLLSWVILMQPARILASLRGSAFAVTRVILRPCTPPSRLALSTMAFSTCSRSLRNPSANPVASKPANWGLRKPILIESLVTPTSLAVGATLAAAPRVGDVLADVADWGPRDPPIGPPPPTPPTVPAAVAGAIPSLEPPEGLVVGEGSAPPPPPPPAAAPAG